MIKLTKENAELLEKLSEGNDKPLSDVIIKLSEENGEVSNAYLKLNSSHGSNYKKNGATETELSDDLIEELIDVIMVASSALYKMGASEKEINKIMSEKLSKWNQVTGNRY